MNKFLFHHEMYCIRDSEFEFLSTRQTNIINLFVYYITTYECLFYFVTLPFYESFYSWNSILFLSKFYGFLLFIIFIFGVLLKWIYSLFWYSVLLLFDVPLLLPLFIFVLSTNWYYQCKMEGKRNQKKRRENYVRDWNKRERA